MAGGARGSEGASGSTHPPHPPTPYPLRGKRVGGFSGLMQNGNLAKNLTQEGHDMAARINADGPELEVRPAEVARSPGSLRRRIARAYPF